MTQKFRFKDIHDKLFQAEQRVEYRSLTSDKIHNRIVTVPRKFQNSDSDKIIVWDVVLNSWHDIQIDTIISIEDV